MSSNNNVIDISKRLKDRKTDQQEAGEVGEVGPVQSISELRAEIIKEERRQVKRTILTQFVGTFAIVPGSGLVKVIMYDVSDNGLGFDVEEKFGRFKQGDEIALRIYLNNQTYFPFFAKVNHCRFIAEEGVYRHGSQFIAGSVNDEALHHFIKFMETVSTSLRVDPGDVMLSKP